MQDLTPSELSQAGLLDSFEMRTQGRFVGANELGLPFFGKGQLERISKMLSEKNGQLKESQIDSVVANETR